MFYKLLILQTVGLCGRDCVGLCGSVWFSAGQCGSVWVSVGQCKLVRVSAGLCGLMLVQYWFNVGSMLVQCWFKVGSMWVHVGSCGFLWVPVG